MPDIFVSYAHVDNDPLAPAPRGWVSVFVENLEKLLGRHLGRGDAFSLWMDNEMRGNQEITPHILGELGDARILLLFLSPGYHASDWCQAELRAFRERYPDEARRIFIVELDRVDKPAGLDLLGYRFWVEKENERPRLLASPVPTPDEKQYYSYLDDLARDLSDELRRLANEGDGQPAEDADNRRTVFLAQVPDSLRDARESVRRYLDQHDLRVVPRGLLNPLDLQASVGECLEAADLVVQLLDANTGQGLPRVQSDLVRASGKPVMQWRAADVDLDAVGDADHLQLLEGDNLIVTSLVDFENLVIKRLGEQDRPEPERPPGNLFVYVDSSSLDRDLARETSDLLQDRGIAHSLPITPEPGMSPGEIRDDLENNLINCDAVMLIFREGPLSQLRNHLMICQRINARRDQPIRLIGAFTERDPDSLNIRFSGLAVFDQPPRDCLQQFLEAAAE